MIVSIGKGKSTRYYLSPEYKLFEPIDIEKYYEKEIDEREIKENFNFLIINDVLSKTNLFTEKEIEKLNELQETFTKNISELSELEFKKQ